MEMPADNPRLRDFVEAELKRHAWAASVGDTGSAWWALERAHIVSQPNLLLHLRVHCAMLGYALRTADLRGCGGQLLRLALAPLGAISGSTPPGEHGTRARRSVRADADPLRPEALDRGRWPVTGVRRLTAAADPAIARTVQRLLGLLAVMALLLSVGITPLAHAAEQLCLPDSEVAAVIDGHVDGDADQAPDGGNGYAHHHGGCHGHHLAGPVNEAAAQAPAIKPTGFFAVQSDLLTSAPANRSLRPPIA